MDDAFCVFVFNPLSLTLPPELSDDMPFPSDNMPSPSDNMPFPSGDMPFPSSYMPLPSGDMNLRPQHLLHQLHAAQETLVVVILLYMLKLNIVLFQH